MFWGGGKFKLNFIQKTQWKKPLRRSKSRRKGYIKMDFKEIICEYVC